MHILTYYSSPILTMGHLTFDIYKVNFNIMEKMENIVSLDNVLLSGQLNDNYIQKEEIVISNNELWECLQEIVGENAINLYL